MTRRVPSYGPLDAKIVIIGEAPGRQECLVGRPFIGPSGHLLDKWLDGAGLRRRDIRTMNVFEYMAPGSNITKADKAEVEVWADSLHTRLRELQDPIVLVPMGNIALRAVMRKPLWSNKSPKIGDWRGSILRYDFNTILPDPERWCKVIPTYHPAASFRDSSLGKLCRADWHRIAGDSQFRARRLPKYIHLVPPIHDDDVTRYINEALDPCTVMAIDIETNPSTREILCVGFSFDPGESLTLPWPQYRKIIRVLCESPCVKVGQNFLYDRYWLLVLGDIEVRGEIHDLLSMHHTIDSTLPHDLATMASLDTRQPFWKRSHKDEDSDTADKEPFERLCIYNGVDCCVSRQLFDVYMERLRA